MACYRCEWAEEDCCCPEGPLTSRPCSALVETYDLCSEPQAGDVAPGSVMSAWHPKAGDMCEGDK